MSIDFENLRSITPVTQLPYIKYSLSDGKLRTGDGREVTKSFSAIFDLRNLMVGWMKFTSPPQFALAKICDELPQKPADDYDSGIQFVLRLEDGLGGEKFVLTHTSKLFGDAIADLYREYRSCRQEGMLPVVAMDQPTIITTSRGTYYRPVFEIKKWVPTDNFDAPPPAGEGHSAANLLDEFFKDAA